MENQEKLDEFQARIDAGEKIEPLDAWTVSAAVNQDDESARPLRNCGYAPRRKLDWTGSIPETKISTSKFRMRQVTDLC